MSSGAFWSILGLTLLRSVWMGFDGLRALFKGDYVTPSSGPYAGQLGPWAGLLRRLGIEPRATPTKIAFLAFALAGLGSSAAAVAGQPWAFTALLVTSMATLWYAPWGTLTGLLHVTIVLMTTS